MPNQNLRQDRLRNLAPDRGPGPKARRNHPPGAKSQGRKVATGSQDRKRSRDGARIQVQG